MQHIASCKVPVIHRALTQPSTRRAGHQLTVLLNTFERPTLLRRGVAHWTSCPTVARLHINWAESTVPPDLTKHINGSVPVTFATPLLTHNDSSLNTRFLPVEGARTAGPMISAAHADAAELLVCKAPMMQFGMFILLSY